MIHFTIDLVMENDVPNGEQLRQKMLKNLQQEYDQENAAKILQDAGIVLRYGRHPA